MTQEEKAKAYDKALEAVKSLQEVNPSDEGIQNWVNENFPELKESEDEKIRKEIIAFLKENLEIGRADETWSSSGLERWIAWLENHDQTRKITHEEICKSYGIPDIGEFSDGYHTFNGLYKQRMILFAVLVNTYKDRAWKSWKHEDGLDCFGGGWFIVGIDTPAGTYTYHYEAKDWDRFDCQVLDKAKHWDGHDEFDVERLFSLVEKQGEQKPAKWSEEDEEMLNSFLHKLEVCDLLSNKECLWIKNKFKALKDRVQPQNHWKPSGEQILALRWILNNIPYNRHKEEISGLLEQLKKLKE